MSRVRRGLRWLGVARARRRSAQAALAEARVLLLRAQEEAERWSAARRSARTAAPWLQAWLQEPLAREHLRAAGEAERHAQAVEEATAAVLACRQEEEQARRWVQRQRALQRRERLRRLQRELDDLARARREGGWWPW